MSQYPPPTDYNPPAYGTGRPAEPTKHSGLGIASIVIAGACIVLLFAGTLVSTIAVMENPQNPEASPMVAFGGLLIIAGALGCLGGAVLGGIGCAMPDRKRVTAIIGLCLNLVGVIGICGLMALGMAAGA